MSIELQSTEVKVRDCRRVREILDSYAWEGVEIELSGKGPTGTLVMTYSEPLSDVWGWPQALHKNQWPDDDFEDDAQADQAWFELFEEKGGEGFLSLLRSLAPFLESPLMILL